MACSFYIFLSPGGTPTLGVYLEAEGLFPAVRIFLDLFQRAGYFFNVFD